MKPAAYGAKAMTKETKCSTYKRKLRMGRRTLTLETGKIARQADGAVLATYGETVCWHGRSAPNRPRKAGFFPAHRELPGTLYAPARFRVAYFKRERAPTERETLTSR